MSRRAITSRSTWPTGPGCWRASPGRSPNSRSASRRSVRKGAATQRRSSSSPTARPMRHWQRRSTGLPAWTSFGGSRASCVSRGCPVNDAWPGVIEAYRSRLPVSDVTPVITLREGGTPLLPAPTLSHRTGCEVYLKVEGANPTGSFKDRGMTLAISKAAQEGAKAVICASTGNTSASAAAYAVRAGMVCAVLVPEGKIAMGKLAQALVHGARLLQVDGNFDDCLELARKLATDYPVALVNSVNRYRLEGQKTAAFEIVDALGDAPDVHCLPVGNAGNISAYWKGYTEYVTLRQATHAPRMFGFQASGAAPIVRGEP